MIVQVVASQLRSLFLVGHHLITLSLLFQQPCLVVDTWRTGSLDQRSRVTDFRHFYSPEQMIQLHLPAISALTAPFATPVACPEVSTANEAMMYLGIR